MGPGKLLALLLFPLLVPVGPLSCAEGSTTNSTVGGQCTYKQYEGRARITSVVERNYPKNGSYEVKFLFSPNEPVSEPFAQVEGEELLLLTKKRSYPDDPFLQANGIEVGREFGCVLKVIVKGACTPTIFEFPSFVQ